MVAREAVHEGKEDPEPADADGHHSDFTPEHGEETGQHVQWRHRIGGNRNSYGNASQPDGEDVGQHDDHQDG